MSTPPKKAGRSAARLVPSPLPAAVVELPPAVEAGVSAPALMAAEAAPPVAETSAPPVAEAVETPAPPVVEEAAAAVEDAAAPVVEALAPVVEAAAAEPPAVRELGDNVRALVEKGLAESRARFAEIKSVAGEASAAVEASCEAAIDGAVALNVKAIEALKAGANANFDFLASLVAAKSVSEVVALHTEFAHKRFEDAAAEAKAVAELARKVAEETAAPLKAQVAKTFKIAV